MTLIFIHALDVINVNHILNLVTLTQMVPEIMNYCPVIFVQTDRQKAMHEPTVQLHRSRTPLP